MKKKWTKIVIAIMACMVLTACGNTTEQSNITEKQNNTEVSESIANNNTEITSKEETDQTESGTENMNSQVSDTEGNSDNDVKDTIVVYFSATGTTKGLAEQLADAIDADIFEIVPVQPYTDADLDYSDDNSHSTLEMNDSSNRSEISGQIDNFDQYQNVIIGYPIWWYTVPMAIHTFLEEYDFSGKTVIPFCTHGTGGLASTIQDIKKDLPQDVTLLDPIGVYRPDVDSSQDEVNKWLDGMGYTEDYKVQSNLQ